MIKNLSTCSLFLFLPFLVFSQWTQVGNNIIGEEGDKIGSLHSISMDASGQTVAIGTPFNSDNGAFSGYAEVYELNGTEWVLKGDRFAGILPDTEGTGSALSLSADGNTLAIGIPYGINGQGCRCGIVQVYDWENTSWVMRGAAMEGGETTGPTQSTNTFGAAIKLSADGNFIVVGASGNTPGPNLEIAGHARVYQWDGSQWAQRGEDIDGLLKLERSGGAVSISDAGDVVAIGGRDRSVISIDSVVTSDVGYVRVVAWDGTEWKDRGEPFFGTVLGEKLGTAVSLSADGNTVAMGGPKIASLDIPGTAKIFDWNGSNWDQRGDDISGDHLAKTGSSVDLSADGNVIAVGETGHNSVYGQARIFKWNDNTWEQVDNGIAEAGAPNTINAFGSAIALSSDGSKVAIGASAFDVGPGGFTNEGIVVVFENQSLVSSVEDLRISEISYYPNPTTDRLWISAVEEIERLEIFTIVGQSIQQITLSDRTIDLDMSDLAVGTYLITMELASSLETIKVVKF